MTYNKTLEYIRITQHYIPTSCAENEREKGSVPYERAGNDEKEPSGRPKREMYDSLSQLAITSLIV